MADVQLATELPPVPVNASWMPGPVNGNDPVAKDLVSVGDRFLVLVCCHDRNRGGKHFWDAHVIVATEAGWDDADGDTWSAWSWDDVSWFMRLDRDTMPQL